MTLAPASATIRYRRLPERMEVFTQRIVLSTSRVMITLAENVSFEPSIRIDDRVVLEVGSDVVWFTFPGAWHDVGRFHRADGAFTGFYANILTPPQFQGPGIWETTDLFLDVWIDPDGRLTVLDEDELAEAQARGWISPGLAARAREEVEWIRRRHREGRWPPEIVKEWPLERALQASSDATQAAQRRPRST